MCVYVGACVMCVCVWRGGISRGKSSEGESGTERGKGKVEIGGRGHFYVYSCCIFVREAVFPSETNGKNCIRTECV